MKDYYGQLINKQHLLHALESPTGMAAICDGCISTNYLDCICEFIEEFRVVEKRNYCCDCRHCLKQADDIYFCVSYLDDYDIYIPKSYNDFCSNFEPIGSDYNE